MPKPIQGINGSGMHTNLSLSDEAGNNLFYDPNTDNQLSELALKFISGVMKNAQEFCTHYQSNCELIQTSCTRL
jgi:glutamine synthetase